MEELNHYFEDGAVEPGPPVRSGRQKPEGTEGSHSWTAPKLCSCTKTLMKILWDGPLNYTFVRYTSLCCLYITKLFLFFWSYPSIVMQRKVTHVDYLKVENFTFYKIQNIDRCLFWLWHALCLCLML